MHLEYEHNLDNDVAKRRIDEYTDKLDNMQFAGGFAIEDLKKSWTDNELQLSFNLKKMVIDRRSKGNIRFKENLIHLDMELPDIIRNFVTDENLENTIRKNLDTILGK
jgi:hypothetical protein